MSRRRRGPRTAGYDPSMPEADFGTMIRAARLGWHWAPPLRAMLRVSDAVGGYLFDLRPGHAIPSSGKGEYRCWWDDREAARFICDAAKAVVYGGLRPPPRHRVTTALRRPVRFVLDEEGRFVRWE